jgi:3'-5' exoribonuclease
VTNLTVSSLRRQAGSVPLLAAVVAQVQSRHLRKTKNDKPFLELSLADATGHVSIKVWSDSPVFQQAEALETSALVRIEARWTLGSFGVEAKDLTIHEPAPAEVDGFFAGDPELAALQDAGFAEICRLCSTIRDPRLHAVCARFLEQMGDRFRRTAAARRNHHARRGGLVEHVVQMMRGCDVLCGVYPGLNRDLLLTGALLHDCGKLWENSYPEHGFTQTVTMHGELIGHISLGIELANRLWRETVDTGSVEGAEAFSPPSEQVKLHLLHLIGSHHGEHQFGSPVLPRTPEAYVLNCVDNLDARLEMVAGAYASGQEIAPGIHERVHPLPVGVVRPLPVFAPPSPEDGAPG